MTQEYDDHGETAQLQHEEKERQEAEKADAFLKRMRLERANRNRVQITASIFMIAIGFLALIVQGDLIELFYPVKLNRLFVLSLGIGLFGTGAALLMLLYLRGALSGKSVELTSTSSMGGGILTSDLEILLAQIKNEVRNLRIESKVALPAEHEVSRINADPLVADLAAQLETRFIDSASQASHIKEIRAIFMNSRSRLERELASLGFRGNLNLVIGVLTTTLAVSLLAFMVLGTIQIFDSLTSLLSYYVPRISVVLFIEVFSFFFLKLYRATLSETRSYQADITSISLKQVAVEAAWANPDVAVRTSLSKDLIASAQPTTQKSADAEKSAVDPKLLSELLEKFSEVVLKKEKKEG